jgi:hypothetical protein
LYFYPNPKSDPNYVLLDIESDKKSVNNARTTIIWIISLSVMIYLTYTVYINGVFKPALYTTGFLFFRIITLAILLFMFSIIIYILGLFGWFYRTYLIIFGWFRSPLGFNSTTRRVRRKNKYVRAVVSVCIYILATLAFAGLTVLLIGCLVFMSLLSVLIGFFMKNVGGVLGMAESSDEDMSSSLLTSFTSLPVTKLFPNARGLTKVMPKGMPNVSGFSGMPKGMPNVPGFSGMPKGMPNLPGLTKVP